MRNRIFGAIGVIWGGWLFWRLLTEPALIGVSSSYQSGRDAAGYFGIVMMAVGLYYFFKKPS